MGKKGAVDHLASDKSDTASVRLGENLGGPGFSPDACLALPTAHIEVMGPDAAVNAVYAKKIAAIDDEGERAAFITQRREEYEADVDLMRLASDLVIDGIVEPSALRQELV